MSLPELCIRRPVMTILLMVSFVAAGLFSYRLLPVAAVPRVDFPTIQVNAFLSGASPETMAASVASILERQFSTISGLSGLSSQSGLGETSITLQFDLNRNIDSAALDVQSAIATATRRLPAAMTTPPSFRKVNPADSPVLILALTTTQAKISDIDAFAQSVILPNLSTKPGVAQVLIFGSQQFAVRVRADLDQLAARGLTLADLQNAITKANANTAVGAITENNRSVILDATGPLAKAADFRSVVVTWQNGAPVRLSDVATVTDGVANELNASWFNGKRGEVLAVFRQPDANTVDTVDNVKAALPQIRASLPPGVNLDVLIDRSLSIRASINDVEISLGIAVLLVVAVIYLFLGSIRATIIPAIALPISIIGTFAGMYVLGHSIDNLSLLALTLCVGFVVDDAIVMLENIQRHIEMGKPAYEAALIGSREVSFTILSMTLSLVAVFIPVIFMSGVVGRMFSEFGLDLSIAIIISGVVSLTLTPMLCSRVLASGAHDAKSNFVVRAFNWLFGLTAKFYELTLRGSLRIRPLMLLAALATFGVAFYFYNTIPKGFFPTEDIGFLTASTVGPDDASFNDTLVSQGQIADILAKDPDIVSVMSIVGGASASDQSTGRFFIGLRDKPARTTSAADIMQRLRKSTGSTPNIKVYFQVVQSINLGAVFSRSQYQYTLQSADLAALRAFAPKLETAMRGLPGVLDVNSDLQLNARSEFVTIDRDAAARLGVSADTVRNLLYAAYGTAQVSTIYAPENTYAVILEADPKFAQPGELLRRLTVRSASGSMIPLDAFAKVAPRTMSLSVNHLSQLPAVTISFNLAPGVSLGQASEAVAKSAADMGLPQSINTSFQGTAQLFQQALGNQGLLLFAAVLVVYIVLGVLYESFFHPLTILSGLPSAGIGALIALEVFGMDLSVIAMIGLVMLIGIVKKNSIMMVDFALERKHAGVDSRDAILEAAKLRFRPIMMTTFAAVFGVLPIALGTGAGAELRQPLGIAVVGGLAVSQLLTLYITPSVFLMFEWLSGVRSKANAPAKKPARPEPDHGEAVGVPAE